jgi:uncharacterized protein (DUF1499 family)
MEVLKQSVVQIKNSTLVLVKENASLKTQIENMKRELTDANNTLTTLQTVSTFNTEQIVEIKTELNRLETNTTDLNYVDDVAFYNESNETNETNEIIETDLKSLIENELNNSL